MSFLLGFFLLSALGFSGVGAPSLFTALQEARQRPVAALHTHHKKKQPEPA